MDGMARRSTTVRRLATDFDLDLDEALVTLWDAGFEYIDDIDDRIAPADLAKAQRSLGLATPREIRTLAYWQETLGLSSEELRGHLAGLGVLVSREARLLPKGALAKLRRSVFGNTATPIRTKLPSEGSATAESPVDAPFEWRCVGTPKRCEHLSADEVRQIHIALEQAFADTPDPVTPPGVRDETLLESAVHRSETSLGGETKYPSAEMVAAALLHSLTHNHPFFNGNKRTALVAMLVSLDRNGLLLTCDEQTLFRYVLRVAQHRVVPAQRVSMADHEVLAIADWVCAHSRPLAKGDKPIMWRELRKILTRFGCTFEGPLPGNKMKVRRRVTARGFLGRSKTRELVAHAWYGGDGREASPDLVHYIRQHLELDDQAGYDSAHFYGTDPRDPDSFIAEYRNILKRLAKL
jgi:death-on-curing family protein